MMAPLNSKIPETVETVKVSLLETLTSLEEIWKEIGLEENQKNERHDTVRTVIQDLLREMLAEEFELKSKMQLKVAEYEKEVEQLYLDLHLPRKPTPPGLTLVKLENRLRNDVDTLNKEKHDRLKWLRRIRAEEQALCEELLLTQFEINFVGTPKLDQLREIEQNLTFLKTEKIKRSSLYDGMKSDIIALWQQLEEEPSDDFELKIKKNVSVTLSNENLKIVEELKEKLTNQLQEMMKELEDKRKLYKQLWSRLEQQLDNSEKVGVDVVPTENTKTALKMLNGNIDYLQELKSVHLKSFIEGIRKELNELYDKCYFGDDQRHNFMGYYIDEFTEETLADHENHLVTMKQYYEDSKDIFKLIAKRETIWEEKINYENRSNDNLLNTRGGALIKALKKKEYIDKQLPKIELTLNNKIQQWETENTRVFMFQGERYIDYIESQKEEYELQLKHKKDEKQRVKMESPGQSIIKHGQKRKLQKNSRIETPKKCPPTKHRGNLTHSIQNSPLLKKFRPHQSGSHGAVNTLGLDKRCKTPKQANCSKYTHSSLQSENKLPKNKTKVLSPKLTTQSRKKNMKRRSIKVNRILKEKNYDLNGEASPVLNKGSYKGVENITMVSYNDFTDKISEIPCSSFLHGPGEQI